MKLATASVFVKFHERTQDIENLNPYKILKTNKQRQHCGIGHCLLKGSGSVALA